ncbi:hypothetical protein [Archangium sp.]|uniref:hypothetical protein n=1 Tax=Archangium sp. TaxID=1872627 RepID=UPI002D2858CF|nr:hypothetical protein [Archangium sp.]HYO54337.1 hypothetical protein [Archangium sp.]
MFTSLNLDERTRVLMLDEIAADEAAGRLYVSDRLTPLGVSMYAANLKEAARAGNERTFTARLRAPGQLKTHMPRGTSSGGMTMAKVPANAPEMLAEGEFNRFYIRALCLRAIADGVEELIVYRAKSVAQPRWESESKVGEAIDPHRLLRDLRANPGVETALGVPGGPGSGLSVRLP